ncbi:hypothetical protein OH77DRAFT_1047315 [Trametes cingulata]|nr:hypothetical protein OH77DRAFT_1047315 [Trametes cingulata]
MQEITWIGYDEFMAEFVPHTSVVSPPTADCGRVLRLTTKARHQLESDSPPIKNPFASLKKPNSEKDMYRLIPAALNNASLSPNYLFVSTHRGTTAEKSNRTVDCGMYPAHSARRLGRAGNRNGSDKAHLSWIDLAIECKIDPVNDDPFDEHALDARSRRRLIDDFLSRVELMFDRQQRTHMFGVLFFGNLARIVRIDRAGLFATHKFDYRAEGVKLAQFLWRYSRLPAAMRGHDTTAVRLDSDSADAQRMKDRVKDVAQDDFAGNAFKKSLDPRWPWWKLQVPDETNPDPGSSRYFLVGKPHFRASDVFGRTTRGYIALESGASSDDKLVFLKDTWRVVSDGRRKEGATLEKLRDEKVVFVPTLICHGDIHGQQTVSQTVWPRYNPGRACMLKAHQHYRLVVKEVGQPLHEVKNPYQAMSVIRCCLTAHESAFDAGILHCDISTGNMLLCPTEDGSYLCILNDWELATTMEEQAEGARLPDRRRQRTGTWAFLSAQAQNHRAKPITIQDELESFFHVLLYMALHLVPHNCDQSGLPQLLHDYFDAYRHCCSSGPRGGPTKDMVMNIGRFPLGLYNNLNGRPAPSLHFLWPVNGTVSRDRCRRHPLDAVISTFLSWFRAHYTLPYLRAEAATPPPEPQDDSGRVPQELMQLRKAKARMMAKGGSSPMVAPPSFLEPEVAASSSMSKPDIDEEAWKQQQVKDAELLAGMLASHAPMLNVLRRLLKGPWPDGDDGHSCSRAAPAIRIAAGTSEEVPEASAMPPSRKRKANTLEDLAATPSKRSKT